MARDLDYLVAGVREEIFLYGNRVPVRNGWAGDADETLFASGDRISISITRQINETQLELARETGYAVDEVSITPTLAERYYTLGHSVISIKSAFHNGTRLRKTSVYSLDSNEPRWRSTANSDALYRYFLWGTTKIGFAEKPSSVAVSTGNVYLLCTIAPADFANQHDPLLYLPDAYAYLLVQGTALRICNMNIGNDLAKSRMPFLEKVYESGKEELKAFMKARDEFDLDEGYMYDTATAPIKEEVKR